MKIINKILTAVLTLASIACEKHLDASQVPAAVKESFEKKYPNATDVEWIKEGSSKLIYEAEFKIGDKEIIAEFSDGGEFLVEE